MERDKNQKKKRIKVLYIEITILFLLAVSFLGLSASAELTTSDFSGLTYTDAKGDDYTFRFEGEGTDLAVTDSYGVKGKYPYIDILGVKAELDTGTSTVSVTVEMAEANPGGVSYIYVFFVDNFHQQSGSLLEPEKHKDGNFSWDYSDTEHTIVMIWLDSDYIEGLYAWSSPSMDSLSLDYTDTTVTYSMSVLDLENAGVTTGSGFGVYAYSHRLDTMGGDTWHNQITWDTAGLGAAAAPDEFNVPEDIDENGNGKDAADKEGEEDSEGDLYLMMTYSSIVIVVCMIIIFFVLYLRKEKQKRLKNAQSQQPPFAQPQQVTQTPQGPLPPPPPPPPPPPTT